MPASVWSLSFSYHSLTMTFSADLRFLKGKDMIFVANTAQILEISNNLKQSFIKMYVTKNRTN